MEWVGVLGDSYLLTGSRLRMEPASDKFSSPLTDASLEEYQLAIRVDGAVSDKILAESSGFYQKYLPHLPIPPKPFVSVARFGAKESMEETLIRWIQRICIRIRSFNITFNNYGAVPAHSIYLRILDKEPFRLLAQELKIVDEYLTSNNGRVLSFSRPGLSIAQQLPQPVYEKAMPDYSQRLFCESFIVREIVLQRKSIESETYKIINVFGLLPEENDLFN